MPSINDSKCVLTAGIGRALALAIADLPSKPTVIGTGRRKERLQELERSGIKTLSLDIPILKKAIEEVLEKYPNMSAFNFRLSSNLAVIAA